MGVFRFFRHLLNTYKGFYRTGNSNQAFRNPVDILLLDCNAIFHPACREIYFPEMKSLLHRPANETPEVLEKKAFDNIIKYIKRIIDVCPPKRVLYLAVDGVAGMCKQSQQRKRRYRTARDRAPNAFDTCNLTTGTPFMQRLMDHIAAWIEQYKTQTSVQIIFNDMHTPGEGEHKLIRYLDMRFKNPKLEKFADRTTYCIYSPDADLIMLCMCLSKGKGYILRENIYDDINAQWIYVNCENLKNLVSQSLWWSQEANVTFYADKVVRDYVLFLMLVGNDFLPNLYCLEIGNEGIETLEKCYKVAACTTNYLVNDANSLEKESFVHLFEMLSSYESNLILRKYHKGCKFPDSLLASYIVHSKLEETGQIVQTLDYQSLRAEYYLRKFKDEFEWSDESFNANVKTICKAYIRGLIFVIKYYCNSIPTFDWYYEYHYAPLMIDIFATAKEMNTKEWNDLHEWNYKPALTLEQSLLGVIPPSSAAVCTDKVRDILIKKKNDKLFIEDFIVDVEGKQQEYEGVCLLPNIPYTSLKRMVRSS